ncbi:MAG: type II toxin-antitoxin system PemK/MazF family toxin [Candidatus Coatesbacteria bacterium]|nr:type II toxin-antitoxin system PemK/MazF family toxin [Candidatus Coatesbacteria bacterium]
MVSPSAGSVVLVSFPFSDLSGSKLRPAVVLASAGRNDWVLCQITGAPYADSAAVRITDADFVYGSLQRMSFARPGKLFAASTSLMRSEVGRLNPIALRKVLDAVISLLRGSQK